MILKKTEFSRDHITVLRDLANDPGIDDATFRSMAKALTGQMLVGTDKEPKELVASLLAAQRRPKTNE